MADVIVNRQTRHITIEDLQADFPEVNWMEDLGGSDRAQAWLDRIEARLKAFIDATFYRNVDREYPHFTDYQKQHYRRALEEQAIYIWRNGDISTDSGYDPDNGQRISPNQLRQVSIAPNAKDELTLCGLWSRKIINRSRGGFDGWLY